MSRRRTTTTEIRYAISMAAQPHTPGWVATRPPSVLPRVLAHGVGGVAPRKDASSRRRSAGWGVGVRCLVPRGRRMRRRSVQRVTGRKRSALRRRWFVVSCWCAWRLNSWAGRCTKLLQVILAVCLRFSCEPLHPQPGPGSTRRVGGTHPHRRATIPSRAHQYVQDIPWAYYRVLYWARNAVLVVCALAVATVPKRSAPTDPRRPAGHVPPRITDLRVVVEPGRSLRRPGRVIFRTHRDATVPRKTQHLPALGRDPRHDASAPHTLPLLKLLPRRQILGCGDVRPPNMIKPHTAARRRNPPHHAPRL